MVLRIDRRGEVSKVTARKGKVKSSPATGAPHQAGRDAGEIRLDRFEPLGRVIGGPSQVISAQGPGQRPMMPLSTWERYDIDHDPLFREAAARMKAYRDLPEPWKQKVDEWGRRVSKEMKYALAKAIMKT